jgi:hypothetical protein
MAVVARGAGLVHHDVRLGQPHHRNAVAPLDAMKRPGGILFQPGQSLLLEGVQARFVHLAEREGLAGIQPQTVAGFVGVGQRPDERGRDRNGVVLAIEIVLDLNALGACLGHDLARIEFARLLGGLQCRGGRGQAGLFQCGILQRETAPGQHGDDQRHDAAGREEQFRRQGRGRG